MKKITAIIFIFTLLTTIADEGSGKIKIELPNGDTTLITNGPNYLFNNFFSTTNRYPSFLTIKNDNTLKFNGVIINPPFDTTNIIKQLVISGDVCRSIGHHWTPIGLQITDDHGNSEESFTCITCGMHKEVIVKITKQKY